MFLAVSQCFQQLVEEQFHNSSKKKDLFLLFLVIFIIEI